MLNIFITKIVINEKFGFLMQAKLCVDENIPVIPIPGPSALVAALSASGLATNEFTFGIFSWFSTYIAN